MSDATPISSPKELALENLREASRQYQDALNAAAVHGEVDAGHRASFERAAVRFQIARSLFELLHPDTEPVRYPRVNEGVAPDRGHTFCKRKYRGG